VEALRISVYIGQQPRHSELHLLPTRLPSAWTSTSHVVRRTDSDWPQPVSCGQPVLRTSSACRRLCSFLFATLLHSHCFSFCWNYVKDA